MVETPSLRILTLEIKGMHCANCEVLIERKFKAIPGIREVNVSHATRKATIASSGDLEIGTLQDAIGEDGYTISPWHERDGATAGHSENTARDYAEIGAAFLILVGIFFLLGQFDLLPQNLAVSDNMSYGLAFLIGLVASVSSCIAVTGGLLVAVAAKYNEANPQLSGIQRFKPHIFFNAGRIVSYTLLGGAVGALGSTLTLSPAVNGILTILASAVMIGLGFRMLRLFSSVGHILPRMPKFIAHKIHDLAIRDTKGSAFVLGAATFFFPCGFTQALQLFVLSKGSFETGALTMLAFSLGTLPALLSLALVSSFARGAFQQGFLKLAGTAVIVLGFINIQYGFVLTDSSASRASIADGAQQVGQQTEPERSAGETQIIAMKVAGFSYVPSRLSVIQGVPVEWRIDASQAAACGHVLIVPKLRMMKFLPSVGTTVISFTPQEAGEFAFNCSMGMMTPGASLTVVPKLGGFSPVPPKAPGQAL